MSLRYVLLGELTVGPRSGYDLVQRFRVVMDFVWSASQAAIYTELGKLEAAGAIRPVGEPGARGRKSYEITDAGRHELREWLVSPVVRDAKDALMARVFNLDQVEPDQAVAFFEDLLASFRERAAEYARRDAEARKLGPPRPGDGRRYYNYVALQAGVHHEAALVRWAEATLAELRAAAGAPASGGRTG